MSEKLAEAVPFVLPVSAAELSKAITQGEVVGVFREEVLCAFFRITFRPETGKFDTVEVRSVRSLSGGAREGITFLLQQEKVAGKRLAMVVLATNSKMIAILKEFGFQLATDYLDDVALRECFEKDTGPRPAERVLYVLNSH